MMIESLMSTKIDLKWALDYGSKISTTKGLIVFVK
jgi:hypothetical protein